MTVSSPVPLCVETPASDLRPEKDEIAELMARQAIILKALDATPMPFTW